jgi:hypothetical protein
MGESPRNIEVMELWSGEQLPACVQRLVAIGQLSPRCSWSTTVSSEWMGA